MKAIFKRLAPYSFGGLYPATGGCGAPRDESQVAARSNKRHQRATLLSRPCALDPFK